MTHHIKETMISLMSGGHKAVGWHNWNSEIKNSIKNCIFRKAVLQIGKWNKDKVKYVGNILSLEEI